MNFIWSQNNNRNPGQQIINRNRRNEVGSSTWGPRAWSQFHTTALHYRPSSQTQASFHMFYYVTFLTYIECNQCLQDYKNLINLYPIRLQSMCALFEWCTMIHNQVNQKLGKRIISNDEAYQIWDNSCMNQSQYTGRC